MQSYVNFTKTFFTVMTNPFEGSVLSNDTLWDPHLDNDAVPLSTVAANRIKRY